MKFSSKKIISFSCKLEIFDNCKDSRIYRLPISGTADNSILTIYPYLSDKENYFKLEETSIGNDKISSQQNKLDSGLQFTVNLRTDDGRNLIDKYHNYYEGNNFNYVNSI